MEALVLFYVVSHVSGQFAVVGRDKTDPGWRFQFTDGRERKSKKNGFMFIIFPGSSDLFIDNWK